MQLQLTVVGHLAVLRTTECAASLSTPKTCGEITGILKPMQDTRQSEPDKATAEKEGAIKSLDALVAAEEKQSTPLAMEIEGKMACSGDGGFELSEMKEALEDTKELLAEDRRSWLTLTELLHKAG